MEGLGKEYIIKWQVYVQGGKKSTHEQDVWRYSNEEEATRQYEVIKSTMPTLKYIRKLELQEVIVRKDGRL